MRDARWLVLVAVAAACDGVTSRRDGPDAGPPSALDAALDAWSGAPATVDAAPVDAHAPDATVDAAGVDTTPVDAPPAPPPPVALPPDDAAVLIASGAAEDPLHPVPVVTPDGGATVVYTPESRTHARSFVPGSGWEAAVPIDADTGSTDHAQVAAAPDGALVAVWGGAGMYANRHLPGTGWTGAVRLDDPAEGSVLWQHIAVAAGPAGDTIAVWAQGAGTSHHVWARRHLPGAGWGPPVAIGTGPDSAGWPAVAFDASGNALAVWAQDVSGGRELWAASFGPGGWTPAVRVRPATGALYGARVAFDGAGTATAVWNWSSGTQSAVESARFSPAGGWSAVEVLATGVIGNVTLTSGPGPLAAVWRVGSELRARRTSAAGWSPLETIGHGWVHRAASLADGTLLVVYTYGTEVYARRHHPASGWDAIRRLDITTSPDDRTGHLALAVSPTGQALVVWEEAHWQAGSSSRAYAAVP